MLSRSNRSLLRFVLLGKLQDFGNFTPLWFVNKWGVLTLSANYLLTLKDLPKHEDNSVNYQQHLYCTKVSEHWGTELKSELIFSPSNIKELPHKKKHDTPKNLSMKSFFQIIYVVFRQLGGHCSLRQYGKKSYRFQLSNI